MSIYTTVNAHVSPENGAFALITKHLPEDHRSRIHGLRKAGWYWHWRGETPTGEHIVGVVYGPRDSEAECLEENDMAPPAEEVRHNPHTGMRYTVRASTVPDDGDAEACQHWCDDGRIWNNGDPRCGQWVPCECPKGKEW